jgi:hypothetical protein
MRLFASVLLVGMLDAIWGQVSTASLAVQVEDEQGRGVGEAKLMLTDKARGLSKANLADAGGRTLFGPMEPSAYELVVERDGFATARYELVRLNANDQLSMRVRLSVEGKQESIQVSSVAALVSESPAVATVVDRSFIENQPLNGRSFQTLIHLAPGVVLAPSGLVEQGQFSVNGQRTGTNYFTVDGVGANFGLPASTTPYEGAGGGVPSLSAQGGTSALASVDAVQEFTIQTSTYAPEYGRQPGAQVAIVTRSGTNALHGSAFEYFRNDKLDANSWFGNFNGVKRPPLRQNDFGFTLGGPITVPKVYDGKNRSFFFVSYEGLRLIQPVVSAPVRVPSMAARERATGLLKSLLEAYPLPIAGPIAGSPDETPYVAGFSNPSRLDATSVRVDHTFSPKLMVFGRYHHAPSDSRERGRFVTPSFVASLPARTTTATFGATLVLGAASSNDVRVNWSQAYAAQIYEQDTFGGAKLLPRELLFPDFAKADTSLFYLTIGGNDENTISPGVFSRNTQNQWNIVDTLSWNVGRHALKLGFDYRRLAPSIGGRLYSKVLTVPTLTQLATGIVPSADVRQVGTFLEPRYTNSSVFVQDAWRVLPRLTLTYGLRWEVNPAPGEANGNSPLTLRGLNEPRSATLAARGSALYSTQFANFAPRLGLAYQVPNRWGTVLRAGFGSFYDLGYAFTGTAFSPGNFPYTRSSTFSNIGLTDARLSNPAGPLTIAPPYPRLFAYSDQYRLPYTLQYSLAVEQPIGDANSFSLSYVGAAGRRLARVESLRAQTLQNPSFTRVDFVNNEGYSDYHSMQMQFKRRMKQGVQALLSYTWSKSLDTASDESITNLQAPSVRQRPEVDRGPSSFDLRHVFTGSLSYEVRGWKRNATTRMLTSGFALDSIVRLRTAAPVTVVSGRDQLGLGLTNVARPDLVAGVPTYLFSESFAGGKRLNSAAFDSAAPLGQARQGNLGRGSLRGFGMEQVDLSVRRSFRLSEGVKLDFRADAFNLFNHANFANMTGVLTSGNFGRSTQILSSGLGGLNPLFQVGGPRSVQLALKLQF